MAIRRCDHPVLEIAAACLAQLLGSGGTGMAILKDVV
jgi:hypothetical protein